MTMVTDTMKLMDFTVEGPIISMELDLGFYKLHITETIVSEFIVVVILGVLFWVLGRNLKVKPESKRQMLAEMIVTTFSGMVDDTMGSKYKIYTPYIGSLFCFSLLSSLMSLFGLRSPTADLSVTGAWGLITFVMVQYNRAKTGGAKGYFKSFIEPLPFMLPFNIIGEIANPVSQSLRHFANILAGMVISGLIYFALGNFAIGVPAVLSLYFDLFSSVIQAYIFVTLTMAYVSMSECE